MMQSCSAFTVARKQILLLMNLFFANFNKKASATIIAEASFSIIFEYEYFYTTLGRRDLAMLFDLFGLNQSPSYP